MSMPSEERIELGSSRDDSQGGGSESRMTAEEMISLRILHTLSIYPKLSMSMLQIGVGTGFPPMLWHPVLEDLVTSGKVTKTQMQATHPVSGRDQTYTVIELTPPPSSDLTAV